MTQADRNREENDFKGFDQQNEALVTVRFFPVGRMPISNWHLNELSDIFGSASSPTRRHGKENLPSATFSTSGGHKWTT